MTFNSLNEIIRLPNVKTIIFLGSQYIHIIHPNILRKSQLGALSRLGGTTPERLFANLVYQNALCSQIVFDY